MPFKTPLDHNFKDLILAHGAQYQFPPLQLISSVQSQIDPKTGQKVTNHPN